MILCLPSQTLGNHSNVINNALQMVHGPLGLPICLHKQWEFQKHLLARMFSIAAGNER